MTISQTTLEFAKKYGQDNGHKQMFVTDKDEVFTSHNLAMNSIGHDPKKIATVNIDPVVTNSGAESSEDNDGDDTGDTTGASTGANNEIGPDTSTTTEEGGGQPDGGNDKGEIKETPKATSSAGKGAKSKKA